MARKGARIDVVALVPDRESIRAWLADRDPTDRKASIAAARERGTGERRPKNVRLTEKWWMEGGGKRPGGYRGRAGDSCCHPASPASRMTSNFEVAANAWPSLHTALLT